MQTTSFSGGSQALCKITEAGQTVKNLVEFAPAGDAPHVVPPRGIAASAYAKKVPLALFLNAAASDKTHYT